MANDWGTISTDLLQGNAEIEIVVGLERGITDPILLSEWLRVFAGNMAGQSRMEGLGIEALHPGAGLDLRHPE
jgi:hypothetical protein